VEVLRVADGEVLGRRAGRTVVLLAERPEVTITWSRYGPHEPGPDPHVHHEHADAFYVVEGQVTFTLGPDLERRTVGPGTFVAAPANLVHTYANDSEAEASWLNLHTPDTGFAAYLRSLYAGPRLPFDQFDQAGGGRPLSDAVLRRPGEVDVDLPGVHVADWTHGAEADYRVEAVDLALALRLR
jgi:quercetin dioxygenase-like cupin family protein